jgi:hypothetical protein
MRICQSLAETRLVVVAQRPRRPIATGVHGQPICDLSGESIGHLAEVGRREQRGPGARGFR